MVQVIQLPIKRDWISITDCFSKMYCMERLLGLWDENWNSLVSFVSVCSIFLVMQLIKEFSLLFLNILYSVIFWLSWILYLLIPREDWRADQLARSISVGNYHSNLYLKFIFSLEKGYNTTVLFSYFPLDASWSCKIFNQKA